MTDEPFVITADVTWEPWNRVYAVHLLGNSLTYELSVRKYHNTTRHDTTKSEHNESTSQLSNRVRKYRTESISDDRCQSSQLIKVEPGINLLALLFLKRFKETNQTFNLF